jgi:hypothetical protein
LKLKAGDLKQLKKLLVEAAKVYVGCSLALKVRFGLMVNNSAKFVFKHFVIFSRKGNDFPLGVF